MRSFQQSFYQRFLQQRLQQCVEESVTGFHIQENGLQVRFLHFEHLDPAAVRPGAHREIMGFTSLTHETPLIVRCRATIPGKAARSFSVKCGDMPLMVMPETKDDPGGYFLVHGAPYVVVPQEQKANNRLLRTREQKLNECCCSIRSVQHRRQVAQSLKRRPCKVTVCYQLRDGELQLQVTQSPLDVRIPLQWVLEYPWSAEKLFAVPAP